VDIVAKVQQDFTATINVTVEGPEPVTKEDAIQMLEDMDTTWGQYHIWVCEVDKVKGGQLVGS
jgi:hypothetical protein